MLPKPGQGPGQASRELSTEEKAERYDQLVNLKAAKRATRQQIARLNRQLEQLDLEENKVLENDLAAYSTSKNLPLGRCTTCGYEVCQCEVVS
jgi:ABC-type phosphate transport system auxiliary subunit